MKRPRHATAVLTAMAVLASLSLLSWSAVIHSPAVDESAHLPAGLSHWEFGSFDLYAVNPPLVRLIAAIPVRWAGYQPAWSAAIAESSAQRPEFDAGRDFIRRNGQESQRLYTIGRCGTFVFFVAGLLCVRHWALQILSPRAAFVAVCLYGFLPSLLTHGSLLTPDAGAAAAGLIAMFRLRCWLRKRTAWNAVLSGGAAAAAMLTKTTWILVLPTTTFVVLLLWHDRSRKRWLTLRDLLISSGICLYVLNLGYLFDGTGTRLGNFQFVSRALSGHAETGRTGNRFRGTLAATIPVPLPKPLIEGIDIQKRDFEQGFRSYLMGEWKHGGWWYYYLVGFLVKEPIAFQLLLGASLAGGIRQCRTWTRTDVCEWSLIVVPALLVFVLVSSQTGFSHHMRYVLPAYPFLILIAARTTVPGRFGIWFSSGCLIWLLLATLSAAPHWMSYFNELAGGPVKGHAWLVDSNIDWGQDLQLLKTWQDTHPDKGPLKAALFAMYDPSDLGLRFQLPPPWIPGHPEIVSKEGLRGPHPGWYAVSVNLLKGLHFHIPDGNGGTMNTTEHYTYFLDEFEPVDRIGYSICLYHITAQDAARVRSKLLAEETELLKTRQKGILRQVRHPGSDGIAEANHSGFPTVISAAGGSRALPKPQDADSVLLTRIKSQSSRIHRP